MNSLLILFLVVPILAFILLLLNFILSPHRPDSEKVLTYECGFSPILGQTRNTFHISFFLIALAFLILDLEILLIYPFGLSGYENGIYGLLIVLIFTAIVTAGFVFELGKNALKIDSRQSNNYFYKSNKFIHTFVESK